VNTLSGEIAYCNQSEGLCIKLSKKDIAPPSFGELMYPNITKEKMQRGECAWGYGIRWFGGAEQARFAANAGFDYLFIDTEHSAFSTETSTALCRTALAAGVTPIVRVCGFDHHLCTTHLDNGAQGIIFPHLEFVEQVEQIGNELYFPPRGDRSMPGPLAINDYKPISHEGLIEEGNKTTLAAAMIELPEAIEHLDELLAPGILGAVMVGANDLSTTLGIPAQWENPKFTEAVDAVVSACKKAGVASGIGGMFDTKLMAHWVNEGMTFMYCLSDSHSLMAYPTARLNEIKEACK
jgi:4-hydroxy-2-oxoheptanedioate aldolase